MTEHPDTQPLAGITVVDLGHIYAAPYATLLLALAGARVIKVEPRQGELLRVRGVVGGPKYAFAMLNSNKELVTIDLKTDPGVELFGELVDRADVLVENFRPGVMERLGLGPEVLRERNPRLVYAHSSGYGRSGPYRDYPAMDLAVQAIAGVVSITGFPDGQPVKAGPAVCDFFSGIHLYGAIVSALYRRTRTHEGAVVEVSMHESVFASMMSNLGAFCDTGIENFRTGNRHGGLSVAPYNVYATQDGHVAIACEADRHWERLCGVMGRADLATDERYQTTKRRVKEIDEVDRMVGAWVAEHRKDEILEQLHSAGVPAAPVKTLGEVLSDPHLHERRMLQEIDHPELGTVIVPHTPLLFEDTGRPPLRPSGQLGRDNRAVFCDWLGVDDERFEHLRATGVI